MTNSEAVEYQHDLSSDNDGAIYNQDQLMPERDSTTAACGKERDEEIVINHAPAHDLTLEAIERSPV